MFHSCFIKLYNLSSYFCSYCTFSAISHWLLQYTLLSLCLYK
jgi:hypothetical protein